MKYTSEQLKKIKKKEEDKQKFIPQITIKDGFYIIQSKINAK